MSRREIPLETTPRLVEPQPIASEVREEADLRPRIIDEFIGQADLIAHLRIMLTAAKQRNQVADHVLFAGPPGLGKTSLAGIVASEMGVGLRLTSGPILTRPGDLAAILTDLQEGDVLFIDEIHRLPRQVEEVLYPAMEDRRLDVLVGRGPSARSIRLELPAFTLVGATTRTGLVAAPLRDRFGFIGRLDLYDEKDLASIVARSAALLDYQVETTGAGEIARRSRGTPRIANRLLRRVRDVAQIEGSSVITGEIARGALTTFGVDLRGLDKVDRSLLTYLCTHGDGRPVGLVTLAQVVGEEPHTIEEAYEPFLIREGLIARTPRGRVATDSAYEHLGVKRLSGGLL
ncbi:MAG: Holliday junction branch migration DNA helicase RuvB [Actinomycetes bacterium]|jgi:Holliday junction DNA helicase RuvB